jgi:3-dehydroquinate synthase
MERILLELRGEDRTCAVFVGYGAYGHCLPELLERSDWRKAALISHPEIMEQHGRELVNVMVTFMGERELHRFTFPPGEGHKNLGTVVNLLDFLLKREFTRNDVILAFGGGVVGDVAGLTAGIYHRGMPYYQLPTTLMAMVDSAIGGKTGVDHGGVKNSVGIFHQPKAVVSDLVVLSSLPSREVKSGWAEVVKYGFLYDESLLRWSEVFLREGLGGVDLEKVVSSCVRHKAKVVMEDEWDQKDIRAVLNYGHTFGHAMESVTGFSLLLHGEAVAAGMMMAARASELLGLSGHGLYHRHRALLMPLLSEAPTDWGLDPSAVYRFMASDKKRKGSLRLVLLEEPGKPRLVEDPRRDIVLRAIEEVLEELQLNRA